jgi:hypothetical protein
VRLSLEPSPLIGPLKGEGFLGAEDGADETGMARAEDPPSPTRHLIGNLEVGRRVPRSGRRQACRGTESDRATPESYSSHSLFIIRFAALTALSRGPDNPKSSQWITL